MQPSWTSKKKHPMCQLPPPLGEQASILRTLHRAGHTHGGPYACGQGCGGMGEGTPTHLQATQPMPSHSLPDSKRQLQWHS